MKGLGSHLEIISQTIKIKLSRQKRVLQLRRVFTVLQECVEVFLCSNKNNSTRVLVLIIPVRATAAASAAAAAAN